MKNSMTWRAAGSGASSGGKPADPRMDQCPFNMNDKVLYHSSLVEAAIFGKSYNAGSLPYVQQ